jgi:hypothetical protein
MSYNRQQVVDFLRRLGYSQAADGAARMLPDPVSRKQFWEFAEHYQITSGELISRMGGSP